MSHIPGVLARRCLRPALVGTAALVLAGCSGGTDDAASAPTSGAAPAAASSSADPAPASGSSSSPAESSPAGGTTSSRPAGGTSSAAAPGTATAGPDRCHTSELTASLTGGDSGAGQRGATVVLRNTGGRTCDVEGFGGVGLLDAAGRALPAQQVRQDAPAPTLLTVAPGATVVSQLQWTVVPGDTDPAAGCPTPASLSVIPPDERDPLTATWSLGPVCDGGRLEQQAYVAG
ncbi:DUF4232 domain-containing protein [Modestobacter sp. L9-4]|uniref:DUF4232 domain-containing protein n=1 Tax=Modestobacter sp. L9-4 TaxID=2851567 RepID=UPI001C77BDFD|nr:DUF4232 domain-containing protein [Modestobacter sp. L9-4]QXG76441.1 DUF4232 domain-containing protein [Modestobacter sp. L9-4]